MNEPFKGLAFVDMAIYYIGEVFFFDISVPDGVRVDY